MSDDNINNKTVQQAQTNIITHTILFSQNLSSKISDLLQMVLTSGWPVISGVL